MRHKPFSIIDFGDTIIDAILETNPVVPVITFHSVNQAVPVAGALATAGFRIIEVALRTEVALAAITRIREQLPSMTTGAGTVRTPDDFARACDAGAQYLVSPGATPQLIAAATGRDIPWLPAGSTVTEIMGLVEHGYAIQKFFPAAALGGAGALEAIRGPLPDVRFCPSGGVDAANFMDYLGLDNVMAVAGSWMAPADAIEGEDTNRIEELARATLDRLRDQGIRS